MTRKISKYSLKYAVRFDDTVFGAAFFGLSIKPKQLGPGSLPEGRIKEKRGGVITAKLKISVRISMGLICQIF